MTLDLATIRGYPVIVDDAAPTVPLTSMSADGGTLVAAMAAENRERFDLDLNVKTDFGAVGNGVADDTAELSEAITYAANSGRKTRLHFPTGTYGVTGQIAHLLGASSNTLTITGTGRTKATIKCLSAFSDPLMYFEGTAADRQQNTIIQDLGFNANGYDVLLNQHKYTSGTIYRGVGFTGFVNTALSAESMWDTKLEDCHFFSGGTATVPAVWLKAQLSSSQKNNNVEFWSCRWENLLGIGVQFDLECRKNCLYRPKFDIVDHCVKCTSDILLEIRGGHVTHCVTGFTGTGVSGHLIDGVAFDGNTGTLISFTSTSNYCQVEGCVGGVPEANSSSVVTLSGTGNVFEATRNRGLTAP